MFGVGDELAVQLFVLGLAVTVGVYAMTLAGWNHKILVYYIFIVSISLVIIAIFWPSIIGLSPILSSIKIKPIYWFALITIAVLLICAREALARKKLYVHIENMQDAKSSKRELTQSSPIKEEEVILAEGFIYTGYDKVSARFSGKFENSGRDAIFYLEFMRLVVGVISPAGWSSPKKTEVFRKDRYSKGEDVMFPIVYEEDGNAFCKLGSQSGELYLSSAFYKARFVCEDGAGLSQSFYLIVVKQENMPNRPYVIGEHFFDQEKVWNGSRLLQPDPF